MIMADKKLMEWFSEQTKGSPPERKIFPSPEQQHAPGQAGQADLAALESLLKGNGNLKLSLADSFKYLLGQSVDALREAAVKNPSDSVYQVARKLTGLFFDESNTLSSLAREGISVILYMKADGIISAAYKAKMKG
ncbi:MAG: hypothetical protein V1866_06740 [archaeon]